MINVEHYEAAIAALPGDDLIVPKSHMNMLLAEMKIGHDVLPKALPVITGVRG